MINPTSPRERVSDWVTRIEDQLAQRLQSLPDTGSQLTEAMHYAVFNGGKRLRPLLVYATGEALQIGPSQLDAPACAVELIHCYSLVHDDLPAMDDDSLRRGRPTVHLTFDEATAILAGDALQALAFETLAGDAQLAGSPAAAAAMADELARSCGVAGMAGGQALDLMFEGRQPDCKAVEDMFRRKTGALIRAAVMMPTALRPDLPETARAGLDGFAAAIGLAFQIRDDLLEFEGETEVIGKASDSDRSRAKATWPGLFGVDAARRRIRELAEEANAGLAQVDGNTEALEWLGQRLVDRDT